MNTLVLLLLSLCACVQSGKKFHFNCSSFSMKYLNGKRIDVTSSAEVICPLCCSTFMQRDTSDGGLKIWSGCGTTPSYDAATAGCIRQGDAVHCDCHADRCNKVDSDEKAADFEKDFLRKKPSRTSKCKEFELVYNWKEGEKKIVSYTKPRSDVTCPSANCHNWMVERSQFETTIHAGCGKLISSSSLCEKVGNTHVECACTGDNCNDIADAEAADSYHLTWNDHFPPGPYPRSGKN